VKRRGVTTTEGGTAEGTTNEFVKRVIDFRNWFSRNVIHVHLALAEDG
jgi:hypothetical protein